MERSLPTFLAMLAATLLLEIAYQLATFGGLPPRTSDYPTPRQFAEQAGLSLPQPAPARPQPHAIAAAQPARAAPPVSAPIAAPAAPPAPLATTPARKTPATKTPVAKTVAAKTPAVLHAKAKARAERRLERKAAPRRPAHVSATEPFAERPAPPPRPASATPAAASDNSLPPF